MSKNHMEQDEMVHLYETGQKFDARSYLKASVSNVTYDPDLNRGDFFMIRTQWTDSTHALAIIKIGEMLEELARCSCFSRSNPPKDWTDLVSINYTIGPLSLTEGIDNSATDFRNWREVFVMPVKCEYRYRNAQPNG